MSRHLELGSKMVQCPSCWEDIELDIDVSSGSQSYTEDCAVCCNPMLVRVVVDEDSGKFSVDVEAE